MNINLKRIIGAVALVAIVGTVFHVNTAQTIDKTALDVLNNQLMPRIESITGEKVTCNDISNKKSIGSDTWKADAVCSGARIIPIIMQKTVVNGSDYVQVRLEN